MHTNSLLIQGKWVEGKGAPLLSENPCTGEVFWKSHSADLSQLEDALLAAKEAAKQWKKTTLHERKKLLINAKDLLVQKKTEFADLISQETGKPHWETLSEVSAVIGKFAISFDAYDVRCAFRHQETSNAANITRHKPHGVAAILGPFNFPVHLPNGHIIPALLAGNTIIFKPSELTPACTSYYIHCLQEAGFPDGVINLIHGGADIGAAIVESPHINALYFTGSWPTGQKIQEKSLAFPGRILALEMGGNNPLIVWNTQNYFQAAITTIHSSYITTGQRCSCARRLIVQNNKEGEKFIQTLIRLTASLKIGAPDMTSDPFMGPLINKHAAQKVREAYSNMIANGAHPLIPLKETEEDSAYVSPILVDCTKIKDLRDEEIFGPFLQLYRADSFDEALAIANNTAYGLCAGILTDELALYAQFWEEATAGVINWNTPLTGASSNAPFGGLGKSGNHRPSAYYAADYCAYPVASTEAPVLAYPFLPQGIAPQ